jgi:hypothetical protein
MLRQKQGDQIGRIFTCWVVDYVLWADFLKMTKVAKNCLTTIFNGKSYMCINFDQKRAGLHFGPPGWKLQTFVLFISHDTFHKEKSQKCWHLGLPLGSKL